MERNSGDTLPEGILFRLTRKSIKSPKQSLTERNCIEFLTYLLQGYMIFFRRNETQNPGTSLDNSSQALSAIVLERKMTKLKTNPVAEQARTQGIV